MSKSRLGLDVGLTMPIVSDSTEPYCTVPNIRPE